MKYIVNVCNAMNNEYVSNLICKCDTRSMKTVFLQSMEIITNACTLHIIRTVILDEIFQIDIDKLPDIVINIDFEELEKQFNLSHENALKAEQLLIDNDIIRPIGFKGLIKL